MLDFALLDKIFSQITKSISFLEMAEKRAVIRSLRIIYFYPDELLRELNNLIETKAADPDTAIAKGSEILSRKEDIDKALTHITSVSVTTNLKLSIEMVEELRRIADFKEGIRATLHAIFFTWMFKRDREEIIELAIAARKDIQYLNSKIQTLEKVLQETKKH
jgi:hypothetical protein